MSERSAPGVGLLSVVLPIHNQADHIAAIVAGYREILPRVWGDYELVLVPNGCTDASIAVCEQLAGADDRTRVVVLECGGWGRAVRAGLGAARGDTLCYTNSARTTPEILAILTAYAAAFPGAVLKANRRIRESRRRRLGSLLYNLEARALFDLAEWDINGTPKVFPRTCAALLELEREDDLIDLEFVVACHEHGYQIVEIPLLATERHGGRSTTRYGSALRMYRGALELRRSRPSP